MQSTTTEREAGNACGDESPLTIINIHEVLRRLQGQAALRDYANPIDASEVS